DMTIDNARQYGPAGGIEHVCAAWHRDSRVLSHRGDAAILNYYRALLDGVAAEAVDNACADDRCYPVINCHLEVPISLFAQQRNGSSKGEHACSRICDRGWAVCETGASLSIAKLHEHILDLSIKVECVHAEFATQPRLLITAERGVGAV